MHEFSKLELRMLKHMISDMLNNLRLIEIILTGYPLEIAVLLHIHQMRNRISVVFTESEYHGFQIEVVWIEVGVSNGVIIFIIIFV